jgi:hypothetical protein
VLPPITCHPPLPHVLKISKLTTSTHAIIPGPVPYHETPKYPPDGPLKPFRQHVRGASLHFHNAPTRLLSAPLLPRKMSLINVLQPHPEDRLHLRLHRARSVILTAQEFVPFCFPHLVPLRPALRPFPRTNTWQNLLSKHPNAESR